MKYICSVFFIYNFIKDFHIKQIDLVYSRVFFNHSYDKLNTLNSVGFRDYLWIGGNDIERDGDWKWVPKQITYMNVSEKQHNTNNMNCMALRPSDRLWNSSLCDLRSSFPLCEMHDTGMCRVVFRCREMVKK